MRLRCGDQDGAAAEVDDDTPRERHLGLSRGRRRLEAARLALRIANPSRYYRVPANLFFYIAPSDSRRSMPALKDLPRDRRGQARDYRRRGDPSSVHAVEAPVASSQSGSGRGDTGMQATGTMSELARAMIADPDDDLERTMQRSIEQFREQQVFMADVVQQGQPPEDVEAPARSEIYYDATRFYIRMRPGRTVARPGPPLAERLRRVAQALGVTKERMKFALNHAAATGQRMADILAQEDPAVGCETNPDILDEMAALHNEADEDEDEDNQSGAGDSIANPDGAVTASIEDEDTRTADEGESVATGPSIRTTILKASTTKAADGIAPIANVSRESFKKAYNPKNASGWNAALHYSYLGFDELQAAQRFELTPAYLRGVAAWHEIGKPTTFTDVAFRYEDQSPLWTQDYAKDKDAMDLETFVRRKPIRLKKDTGVDARRQLGTGTWTVEAGEGAQQTTLCAFILWWVITKTEEFFEKTIEEQQKEHEQLDGAIPWTLPSWNDLILPVKPKWRSDQYSEACPVLEQANRLLCAFRMTNRRFTHFSGTTQNFLAGWQKFCHTETGNKLRNQQQDISAAKPWWMQPVENNIFDLDVVEKTPKSVSRPRAIGIKIASAAAWRLAGAEDKAEYKEILENSADYIRMIKSAKILPNQYDPRDIEQADRWRDMLRNFLQTQASSAVLRRLVFTKSDSEDEDPMAFFDVTGTKPSLTWNELQRAIDAEDCLEPIITVLLGFSEDEANDYEYTGPLDDQTAALIEVGPDMKLKKRALENEDDTVVGGDNGELEIPVPSEATSGPAIQRRAIKNIQTRNGMLKFS
ncbi:Hypothetical predicted protein [Lecanosticta acicola]|uniref:Uncharacterized protein n=1 Tax=Lecanosticta acicola TaxID=111012 RepID=A0AAI9E939_9PEZI|nr:Hypothetical predicted protein [Lecanosticta acicola]